MQPPPPLAVVDDDAGALHLMERLLRISLPDHPVHPFSAPADLLAALPALEPALVITDYHLGGMDGLTLARTIKRCVPQTQVLMVSVERTPAVRAALADGSLDHFLQKPFELVDLLDEVKARLRAFVAGGASRMLGDG